VKTQGIELRQALFQRKNDRFGLREDIQRVFLQKDNIAQLSLLEAIPDKQEHKSGGFVLRPKRKYLCVANTHLTSEAPEYITVMQMQVLLHATQQFLEGYISLPKLAFLIIMT